MPRVAGSRKRKVCPGNRPSQDYSAVSDSPLNPLRL